MAAVNELPTDLQAPPAHLSQKGRDFFLHVVALSTYDAPARALLGRFCEVRDELDKIRETPHEVCFVDKHGQPRIHPLVKHELALTNEYGKLFRLLGWDQAPPGGQMDLF